MSVRSRCRGQDLISAGLHALAEKNLGEGGGVLHPDLQQLKDL